MRLKESVKAVLDVLPDTRQLIPVFLNKKFIIAGAVALCVGLILGVVQADFAPAREPYDYSVPCDPKDDELFDRCGSLSGPVFNSFVNTPHFGDERTFLDAKPSDQPGENSYSDSLSDVTEGTNEMILRLYVHNNAHQSTNSSGVGVAHNTKVRIVLPTDADSELRARGYISADNVALVADTVDFSADSDFRLEYIPGTAVMYNNNFIDGQPLNDSIVTTGAPIGDDALDGELAGGFNNQSTINITVKIIPEVEPEILLKKTVKASALDEEYSESVTVQAGDTAHWRISYINNGSQPSTKVRLYDSLPPHITVLPGSIQYVVGDEDSAVLSDSELFSSQGHEFGSIGKNKTLHVMFKTTAQDNFEGCSVTVQNLARYTNAESGSNVDDAGLTIKKPNCIDPDDLIYCDSLSAAKYRLAVNESAAMTATGVSANMAIEKYTFKVNNHTVQSSSSNTYNFTGSNPGKYTVTVSVESADGQTATSGECTKIIAVEDLEALECESLHASTLTLRPNETVKLTAQAGHSGPGITGYMFTVNGKIAQDSESNTYEFRTFKVGVYDIEVTVRSASESATSAQCAKTIDVVEKFIPIYRCDGLVLSKKHTAVGETLTASARISAKNGANFKLAFFAFGDEQNTQDKFITNNVGDGVVVAQHTYSEVGDYGVSVQLDFEVNGELVSVGDPACAAQVTVSQDGEVKSDNDKNLPDTGAASTVGIVVLIALGGSAVHRHQTLKKSIT